MKRTIIFSDIDGTFLDKNYKIVFDREFLNSITEEFRIVFVSSRTADEIVHLLDLLGWKEDFIAENGAVLGFRDIPEKIKSDYRTEHFRDYFIVKTGIDTKEIIAIVENILTGLKIKAVIVNKLSPEQAGVLSGYDVESAKRSLDRKATVLIKIESENDMKDFEKGTEKTGLSMNFGGKWLSVGTGMNKGEAIEYYIKLMNINDEETAGIGNSDNDLSLLNSVSKKFIINDNGYNEKLTTIENTVRLKSAGVKGWTEMITILSSDHS